MRMMTTMRSWTRHSNLRRVSGSRLRGRVPVLVRSVDGVGQVTSNREMLIWDLENILSGEEGGEVICMLARAILGSPYPPADLTNLDRGK
jgi:hypothetical protein